MLPRISKKLRGHVHPASESDLMHSFQSPDSESAKKFFNKISIELIAADVQIPGDYAGVSSKG
jgi:hypothetical protein